MTGETHTPVGWRQVQLADICEKITQGPNPKYDSWGVSAYRVLKTKDLYDDKIHYTSADTVSEPVFMTHLKAELTRGDLLLAIVGQGSINKCNVFEGIPESRFIFTRALGLIRPKIGVVNPYFLKYFLQSDLGKSMIDAGIGGTSGQQVVTTTHLKGLKIPLPPLEEQQRIVAVLDEAFADVASATANAEKNLANARELFESYLARVFSTEELNPDFTDQVCEQAGTTAKVLAKRSKVQTSTGGREATTRPIQGRRALGVGTQKSLPPAGWAWCSLSSIARLESGHTPSRGKSIYWNGQIPWVSIRDAKAHHGETISTTQEMVTEAGIANSSARVLPAGTVCLSRTASLGYVTVMGRDMATSQDFLNWVCSEAIVPEFLQYLFQAQRDDIFRFSSGAVHQTIYYPEAKAFYVCVPPPTKQREIVWLADALKETRDRLEEVYRAKLAQLASLKQSLLRRAFTGQLTEREPLAA